MSWQLLVCSVSIATNYRLRTTVALIRIQTYVLEQLKRKEVKGRNKFLS